MRLLKNLPMLFVILSLSSCSGTKLIPECKIEAQYSSVRSYDTQTTADYSLGTAKCGYTVKFDDKFTIEL